MDIARTALAGVLILTPRRFGDHRGFFSESWSRARLADQGIDIEFVQDNHSLSTTPGTVRGLHFQAPPHAQHKLVRCGRGALFDVAVDIRRGSPAYGRWTGAVLSADNGAQLLVPAGFAHGFLTLTAETEIVYKCSDGYAPEAEGAVLWNDPAIGIDWPRAEGEGGPVLSDKDAAARPLSALDSPFDYGPYPWEEAGDRS